MKRYSLPLLLATALIFFAVSVVHATSVVVGTGNRNNAFPFSSNYVGEYQQIYSSTVFSEPFLISSLAFRTGSSNTVASASYNFTLSLGVTSRPHYSPGDNYSGTFVPVFSGPLVVNYTSAGNFDFVVPLLVPFLYDPALGNLLMDVFINSPSSDSAFFSATFGVDNPMGRVYNVGGNGPPQGDGGYGLDTKFTGFAGAPVPDAGMTALLLGIGVLGIVGVQTSLRGRKVTD